MAVTQYIGSRYVPILADPVEWSNAKEYEPLTIVTHEGNSYTSRQFVPNGIDIDNETYWVLTGNYNAQIEQYRRDTAQAVEQAQAARDYVDTQLSEFEIVLNGKTPYVTPEMFGAVGDGVSNDTEALKQCASSNLPTLLTKSYYFNEEITFNASVFGSGNARLVYASLEPVRLNLNANNLTVAHVQFSCNNLPMYAIFVNGTNCTIQNCYFENCNVAIRSLHGLNIYGCMIHNAETGVYVGNCSEQVNIYDYVFINDQNYKIGVLATPGKSGILIEETTSVVNINNAYIENVHENFVYSQAYKTFVKNSTFVNGLVVKGVGYDDYMQDTCVIENCTFIDTYRRFTGNVFHSQIYTCINTIWKNIVYIGDISTVFFSTAREANHILIDGFTGNVSGYPILLGSISDDITIRNVNMHYATIPQVGLCTVSNATINKLVIEACSYFTDAILTNPSQRHAITVTNSTITSVDITYTTNIIEINYPTYNGIVKAIYKNNFVVFFQNIFNIVNACKESNVIVSYDSIVISGPLVLPLYMQSIDVLIDRYLQMPIYENCNAYIECYSTSGKEEYSITDGALSKLSGSTTSITQSAANQPIAMRGDQHTFKVSISIL